MRWLERSYPKVSQGPYQLVIRRSSTSCVIGSLVDVPRQVITNIQTTLSQGCRYTTDLGDIDSTWTASCHHDFHSLRNKTSYHQTSRRRSNQVQSTPYTPVFKMILRMTNLKATKSSLRPHYIMTVKVWHDHYTETGDSAVTRLIMSSSAFGSSQNPLSLVKMMSSVK